MGARALAAAVAAALAACGGPGAELALGAADTVPAAWLPVSHAHSGAALVWVFRTEDCLTCQGFDFALRRLQRTYGSAVPLAAVHVGHAAHASIPRAFFSRRRVVLSAETRIDPREFSRRYGEVAMPALLAVREGRIVWSSTVADSVPLTEARLDSLLRSFVAPLPVRAAEHTDEGRGQPSSTGGLR